MLSKTKISEIAKYAVSSAKQLVSEHNDVILTEIEEDVSCAFDLTEKQINDNDISFKIYDAINKCGLLGDSD